MRRLLTIASSLLGLASIAAAQAPLDASALSDRMGARGVSVAAFPSAHSRPNGTPRIRSGLRGAVRISLGVLGPHDPPPPSAHRSTVDVCGVRAERTEVRFAATPSERISEGLRHQISPPRAARVYVTVDVPHDERVVRIEWSVLAARREALRAIEDAYFASIRCE